MLETHYEAAERYDVMLLYVDGSAPLAKSRPTARLPLLLTRCQIINTRPSKFERCQKGFQQVNQATFDRDLLPQCHHHRTVVAEIRRHQVCLDVLSILPCL
jgi:hypothetical protein